MGVESLKLGENRRGGPRQSTPCRILTLSPYDGVSLSNAFLPPPSHSEEVIRLVIRQNQDHLHLRQAVELRCCHGESTEEVRTQSQSPSEGLCPLMPVLCTLVGIARAGVRVTTYGWSLGWH